MPQHKNKLAKNISTIFTIALFSLMFFSCPAKTQAAFWPGVDPPIQRMLDTIYQTIQGIIMGAAKQAAVKMLNSQIDSLVSGNGSGGDGAAFITDWRDYLVIQPQNSTDTYMNSYLTKMTGGRGSSSGYSSEGFSGAGNYASSIVQMEKNNMTQRGKIPQMTYQSDPSKMFNSGNFKNLELYLSGVNNPWAADIAFQNAYQRKLDEQTLMQQTRAIAYQGFKGTSSGTGDDETVTYPGSLTKDSVANVENIGNNVIASAQSIPEVISSVVSQMITKAIQKGFDGIQKSVQNEDSSQNKLDSGTNDSIANNGPGVLFGN
ncbi:MAG: hypothetical protein WC022_01685 [Parcubacteria group bacterium]